MNDPCYKCITLGICKSRVLDHIHEYAGSYVYKTARFFSAYMDVLKPYCSLIGKYHNSNDFNTIAQHVIGSFDNESM